MPRSSEAISIPDISMTTPENPTNSELEQNKRQAALALAQQYQIVGHRGLDRLKHDARLAQNFNQPRYRGWLVETYIRAVELWGEALAVDRIGAGRDLTLDRRPAPQPKPKPTISGIDKPIRALPISKAAETKSSRPKTDIFSDKRKAAIDRELSGEVDLESRKPEEFPIELFFTDRSEIVVTERTPGVFGQYYQHPFDRSPRVFRDDKQPRVSRKFKKT